MSDKKLPEDVSFWRRWRKALSSFPRWYP